MHSNKVDDIEILRALAVLLVVLEHLHNLLPGLEAGNPLHVVTSFWGGVDIFFAISGFVITSQLMRVYDEDRNRLFVAFAVPFWIRRIYRIWPSALLWSTLVLVASIGFRGSGAFGDPIGNFADWVAAVLQVANLHWYHCYQQKGTCGVNTIFWSLSLEEQFYLIFPFVFIYLIRYSRESLILALLSIILAQFFFERPPHSLLWYLRTDALAWGSLVALVAHHPVCKVLIPDFLKCFPVSALSTVALIVLISALGPNRVTAMNTGLIAMLSGLLVFIAAQDKKMIWPRGLGRSVLVWIGARSYAIYLIHNFVFWTIRESIFRTHSEEAAASNAWMLCLFALVAILLLSDLNLRLVENPLRRKGAYLARKVRQSIEDAIVAPR